MKTMAAAAVLPNPDSTGTHGVRITTVAASPMPSGEFDMVKATLDPSGGRWGPGTRTNPPRAVETQT